MTKPYLAWDISRFTENDSKFVQALPKRNVGVKVGLISLTARDKDNCVVGHTVLDRVKTAGGRGIYDGKFGDIPFQVAGAVSNVTHLGVEGITVRANAERAMLRAAVAARNEAYGDRMRTEKPGTVIKPILFGVAVLSSEAENEEAMLEYAERALECGFDGMVAPGRMLALLKRRFPTLKILAIGIRPKWATWIRNDDQQQTITHLEARDHGADYAAIGRAISHAPNALEALDRILHEMEHIV